jgi:hypothetical protein
VAVLLLLFALLSGAWWTFVGRHESLAKDVVGRRLTDPESALYRNIRYVGGGRICGEVNARNLEGGYVGYRRFVIPEVGEHAILEPTQADVAREEQENALSSAAGLPKSRTYFIAREVFATFGAACS